MIVSGSRIVLFGRTFNGAYTEVITVHINLSDGSFIEQKFYGSSALSGNSYIYINKVEYDDINDVYYVGIETNPTSFGSAILKLDSNFDAETSFGVDGYSTYTLGLSFQDSFIIDGSGNTVIKPIDHLFTGNDSNSLVIGDLYLSNIDSSTGSVSSSPMLYGSGNPIQGRFSIVDDYISGIFKSSNGDRFIFYLHSDVAYPGLGIDTINIYRLDNSDLFDTSYGEVTYSNSIASSYPGHYGALLNIGEYDDKIYFVFTRQYAVTQTTFSEPLFTDLLVFDPVGKTISSLNTYENLGSNQFVNIYVHNNKLYALYSQLRQLFLDVWNLDTNTIEKTISIQLSTLNNVDNNSKRFLDSLCKINTAYDLLLDNRY